LGSRVHILINIFLQVHFQCKQSDIVATPVANSLISIVDLPPVSMTSGARWPRKIGGREPCSQSQTPTYDIAATAGKQATAGMLATPRMQHEHSLSEGHQQEKAQPQKQKDLCGKAIKVAGNEARNMAVNVAV
jgi:hypothetical protein